MARLTIAGVTAYAAKCGYTLEKNPKHYGYLLNGCDWVEYSTLGSASIGYGLHSLATVIGCIRNGHLLNGQSSPLPDNQAIAQQELEAYIDDQAVEVEAQARVKCIYPNCEQPCTRDCDSVLKCDCGESFTDAVEFIVHNCVPQSTPQNASIYIDEIIPSPIGGYEVVTEAPQMQRYEVPLLEKCLELEPEPTLADVIREFNDLPIFVSHLPRKASFAEVAETIITLSRYAGERMVGHPGIGEGLRKLLQLRNECKSNAAVSEKIVAMHEIVCLYRDFRKAKQKA
jgi:hypothetical protein